MESYLLEFLGFSYGFGFSFDFGFLLISQFVKIYIQRVERNKFRVIIRENYTIHILTVHSRYEVRIIKFKIKFFFLYNINTS